MNFKKTLYTFTHWEKWHYHLKYIPLYPAWIWYCLRSGSFWWFTPSNPTLTFGGFEGESKKEMYDQLPPSSYPESIYISPSLSFEHAEKLFVASQFTYPFAVKPDVGMMGFMFRQIDNETQFKKYHSAMSVNYILQELIQYPVEVSVFYYRFPNEKHGNISGFIKKEMLQVEGDGISTLWQLVNRHPIARHRLNEIKSKHEGRLQNVIQKHQTYILSQAYNLSRGGKLISLEHEKNETLLAIFDNLSHYAKHFYYGRYDIKCASVADLKQGKIFQSWSITGVGQNHITSMEMVILYCRLIR